MPSILFVSCWLVEPLTGSWRKVCVMNYQMDKAPGPVEGALSNKIARRRKTNVMGNC